MTRERVVIELRPGDLVDRRQASDWQWPARWLERLWIWSTNRWDVMFLFRPLCWWNGGHEIDGDRWSPKGYCVICWKHFDDLELKP